MSKTDESLALLPNGFVDILPPDAEGEANSITVLMETFRSFGYRRIKPPIFEFEDSLLAPGPGEGLASETFRLMDPMSHRMLGVRSDITAQVARIVSSRLGSEPRPLRLTYANDALRTRGSQMRTERQFTQVGCELVQNIDESHADVEICVLSLLGLKALGLKDITLDLTVPGFVASLMKDIPEDDQEKAAKAVEQRDVAALKALSSPQAELIAKAMDVSGDAEKALTTLSNIDFEADIKHHIAGLKALCDGIESALKDLGIDDVSLSIDLIEQKGFEYHKAFGFTLFSATSSGELGRGGSYDIHFGQKAEHETARGFTLYMDTISKFTRAPAAIEAVFVPAGTPWSEIKKLQEDGHIIVRGTANSQSSKGCSHIYKNGTVEKLS